MALLRRFLFTLISLLVVGCTMPLVQKNGNGSPLFIYWLGDSRGRGFGTSDPPTKNPCAQLMLRQPPYIQSSNASVDGLRLFDVAGDSTKIANTVAAALTAIGSSSRSAIVIQLDINDWSSNETAAQYGSMLGQLLDALHTGIPGATVVVFCSLDYQTYGSANTAVPPATMQDYVTQQTAVVSARTSYAQLVLGKPMLVWPNGFFDNKHPNDSGDFTVACDFAPLVQGWFN